MKVEVDICSSCGQKKQIHQAHTIGNHLDKIYCKECFEDLYGEISCKFCGLKMHIDCYHNHLMDFHRD